MSTKIYYGFKFNHNDPVLATKQLLELQKEAIEYAVNDINVGTIQRLGLDIKKYTELFEEFLKDQYRFDIAVRFLEDKIVGIPFFQRNDLYALLEEKEWFEEYGYWNNSDPPEDFSDKEWDKRHEEWEFLRGYGTPTCQDMFVLELINPELNLSWWAIKIQLGLGI